METKSAPEVNVGESDIENSDEASEENTFQKGASSELPNINDDTNVAASLGEKSSKEEISTLKSNASEDMYTDVGLSAKTASILAKTTVPASGYFRAVIDKAHQIVDLDPAWKKLPITTLNDQRRFTGDWTSFFDKIISGINLYCVFSFKNNRIKRRVKEKKDSIL